MAEEKVGFVTMGAAGGGAEVDTIGVGMLGYAFMGKAHSNAYKKLAYMTWPPPLMPQLVAIAGRNEEAVGEAATRYGFEGYVTDWRELVGDERIGLFDNSGPNNLHAEPSIAAAEAGKHVICEKPLGRDADESYEAWQRVDAAGVKHMCAFNYRFVPAMRLARQLIESGELGEITHFRGSYLQEWGTIDDEVWRFDKSLAGSGALGDLGAHVIDLARYLVGEIESVAGVTATFKPGPRGRRRIRVRRDVRGRRGRHDRSDALCHRPQERLQLGDQRLKGVARLRPRAAQRAAGPHRRLEPRRVRTGLPQRARQRGRPPLLGMVVAARPHHRLGAQLRARAPPPAHARSATTPTSRPTAPPSRTATAAPRSATRSCAPPRTAAARRSATGTEWRRPLASAPSRPNAVCGGTARRRGGQPGTPDQLADPPGDSAAPSVAGVAVVDRDGDLAVR